MENADDQTSLTGMTIMCAYADGVLSEGQASKLLGKNRVELRRLRDNLNSTALALWKRWREQQQAEKV